MAHEAMAIVDGSVVSGHGADRRDAVTALVKTLPLAEGEPAMVSTGPQLPENFFVVRIGDTTVVSRSSLKPWIIR